MRYQSQCIDYYIIIIECLAICRYAAVHYSLPYAQLYGLNQHLASTGAVVISVNYRGGPGYGVAFRAANGSGWQGASEYQDVRAAAMYLKDRSDIGSVGIYGLSYGGLNAMQVSIRVPSCGVECG